VLSPELLIDGWGHDLEQTDTEEAKPEHGFRLDTARSIDDTLA